MKSTIFILFVFLIFHKTNAQYSIAGSTVGIYIDIVPDVTILSNDSYSYSIDINQDGTNDIGIISYAYGQQVASGYAGNYYIYATSLNDNIGLYFWKKICAPHYYLLFPFNIGDIISNSDYVVFGYLSVAEYIPSSSACSNSEWIDNTGHYIGVRYSTNIDTAYGWIGIDVLGYRKVIIKDFALEKNPVVGIKELAIDNLQLTIYPNPAQTQLHIKSRETEIKEIKIISITGSELINTTQKNIDVSNLPNGIYFAQIKTDKGVGARKIVVQH